MLSLLLVLFSTIPQDIALSDAFDKVELNHFYDDQGRHVFDQVLWYDWDIHNRHTVGAWRLVKNTGTIPVLNRQSNLYESLFSDNGTFRKVTAKYYSETWMQYDPELVDREFLPKEKRRDLQKVRTIKPQPVDGLGNIFRIFEKLVR